MKGGAFQRGYSSWRAFFGGCQMLCGEACSRSRLQAARDDRVAVQLPERLAPVDVSDQTIRFGLIDAVRVVVEASRIIAPAIASSSRKTWPTVCPTRR